GRSSWCSFCDDLEDGVREGYSNVSQCCLLRREPSFCLISTPIMNSPQPAESSRNFVSRSARRVTGSGKAGCSVYSTYSTLFSLFSGPSTQTDQFHQSSPR